MTPSLRETIGTKTFDVATKLGLDKEKAKYLMQTAQDAADVIPGIGAAVGTDDTKRAFDRGDYGEALINGITTALGEIPGGGDVAAGVTKAIFGGITARRLVHDTMKETADFKDADEAFSRAVYDRDKGFITPDEFEDTKVAIWKELGWFKGKDGKWRFEIGDDKASVDESVFSKQDVLDGKMGIPLDIVMDHKELFHRYPDLKDTTVYIDPKLTDDGGYYDIDEDAIYLSKKSTDHKTTLIHEIQHAVQEREGFARGANPSMDVVKPGHPSWDIFLKNKDALLNPMTREEWEKMTPAEFRLKGYRNSDKLFGNSYTEYRENLDDEISNRKDELLNTARSAAAWTHYRRSAGENEAKAVERRIDYGPTRRWEKYPEDSEPYPRDTQIAISRPPKKKISSQTDKAFSKSEQRERKVTVDEFKELMKNKKIRPASLEDVSGTHHKRPLYKHPNTGQWFVEISDKQIEEMGQLQRDKPERAMVEVQRIMKGGVLSPVVEHGGDLQHRVSEWKLSPEERHRTFMEKVSKVRRMLNSGYGFEREMAENISVNKTDKESLTKALNKFADEHQKLPTYTRLHEIIRDANVAVGRQNWQQARIFYDKLDDIGKDFEQFKDLLK